MKFNQARYFCWIKYSITLLLLWLVPAGGVLAWQKLLPQNAAGWLACSAIQYTPIVTDNNVGSMSNNSRLVPVGQSQLHVGDYMAAGLEAVKVHVIEGEIFPQSAQPLINGFAAGLRMSGLYNPVNNFPTRASYSGYSRLWFAEPFVKESSKTRLQYLQCARQDLDSYAAAVAVSFSSSTKNKKLCQPAEYLYSNTQTDDQKKHLAESGLKAILLIHFYSGYVGGLAIAQHDVNAFKSYFGKQLVRIIPSGLAYKLEVKWSWFILAKASILLNQSGKVILLTRNNFLQTSFNTV